MKQNSILERLKNGILSENPTFVLMLGMCPTLAVTTSAVNGLGMGLTTMVVLAMSNMLISLLRNSHLVRNHIPKKGNKHITHGKNHHSSKPHTKTVNG